MNNYQDQLTINVQETSHSFCTKTYEVDGKLIVNNYKCDQQPFTPVDLWRLQNKKRIFGVGRSA